MKIKSLYLLLIFRVMFILAMAFTTYMALVNPSKTPMHFFFKVWDKLLHASTFFILSYLLDRSFPPLRTPRQTLHPAKPAFLFAYGIAIEWMQSFTSYREASAFDVLADAVGLFAYWLFCSVYHFLKIPRDAHE